MILANGLSLFILWLKVLLVLNIPLPVWLIALAQTLGMVTAPIVIFVGGFLGVMLAPSPAMATLPIAALVVGSAVASMPAAFIMQKIGRRRGFVYATILALLGSILAFYSVSNEHFWGLCFSIVLLGMHLAFVQQFRFAALEWVKPEQAATTASVVLMGGLVAAWVGPEMVMLGKELFAHTFSGVFVLLAISHSLLLLLLNFIPFAKSQYNEQADSGRSLKTLLATPAIGAAVASGAVAYGVMSLIMTATPVSMTEIKNFPLQETKTVIQSHIMAMFLPSLITPLLIRRLSISGVLLLGVLSMVLAISIAMFDQSYWGYWAALVLLGLGWNFLFVGGTTLLMQSYQPQEGFRVQAVNEVLVFSTQAIMSLLAGWLVFSYGWFVVNLLAIPLLILVLIMLSRCYLANTKQLRDQ
jgi:MFS family permease